MGNRLEKGPKGRELKQPKPKAIQPDLEISAAKEILSSDTGDHKDTEVDQLKLLIERMVVHIEELSEYRAEAKAMGSHPQAFNPLATIISANPKDRGQSILTEFLRIADVMGLETRPNTQIPESDQIADDRGTSDGNFASDYTYDSEQYGSSGSNYISILKKTVFAFSVSALFLWLLR